VRERRTKSEEEEQRVRKKTKREKEEQRVRKKNKE